MFGFVQTNFSELSEEEQARYRSVYCGLCHRLGETHGQLSRLGLTYDMTFLILMLSSLYEPEEIQKERRCGIHPLHSHCTMQNRFTDYAADMSAALMYYKALDDWEDEHKLDRKWYASVLKKEYEKAAEHYPKQCLAIRECISEISEIEKKQLPEPDAAANSFARLMGILFSVENDFWSSQLTAFGEALGRYIYLADAAVDLEKDRKTGNYNPLNYCSYNKEEIHSLLTSILGEAAEAFEKLPLIQDINILRNILYSGIWIKYNREVNGISSADPKRSNE